MRRFCTLVLTLALLLPLTSCGARKPDPPLLSVLFFDVGQGDATLLCTADGNILIDAGPESAEETLCDRLAELGVDSLRLLVLTHPDEDHIGGADAILREFSVDEVWLNGADETGNESFARLTDALRTSHAKILSARAGDHLLCASLVLTVLFPFPGTEPLSGNEGSLILRAQCGDVSILFPGDAGTAVETVLLTSYDAAQLAATVLHAGHHSSNTSTGADFLSAVHPEYTVISCGAGNRYGHPNALLLDRLRQSGTTVYRTDLSGTIRMETDGKAVRFPE